MKIRYLILFLGLIPLLTACGDSDIKDNFCGVHIGYQYCKCAFHGEHCSAVGMNRSEANAYVYGKYDEWKNGGIKNIKSECTKKNGFILGSTCVKCDTDEHVNGNKCVVNEEENNSDDESKEEKGECKYDSDCDNICEADVMWKQGCNPRKNECVKTFDTDCSADIEKFSDFSFPKICSEGVCVRDQSSIDSQRQELENTQTEKINEVKELNVTRDNLKFAMLDANKNCLNGLADMTNIAIVEFATRVASIMAGGLPGAADLSVDYASDVLNKLYGYIDNPEPKEEKKLKPHEYIKLNCDLYHYFIGLQAESDKELEELTESAKMLEEQINSLP